MYNIIKEIRSNLIAPVDVMGCYNIHECVKDKRLYVLISLILSSQTKDEINYQTMLNLMINLNQKEINLCKIKYKIKKSALNNEITTNNLLEIYITINNNCQVYKYYKNDGIIYSNKKFIISDNKLTLDYLKNEENLKDLIRPVGFHNKKYQTIKDLVKFISKNGYPKNLEECMSIKGLGRKMSILYLNIRYENYHLGNTVESDYLHIENENIVNNYYHLGNTAENELLCHNNKFGTTYYTTDPVGISVDTHVHRICNLLNIVSTNIPDQTSKDLEKVLNKEDWSEFNNILVGYGQVVCMKRKPKCDQCKVREFCKKGNIL